MATAAAFALPAGTVGRVRSFWTDEVQPDGSIVTVKVTSEQVVAEGITAWFSTLPTVLPSTPGIIWNNGGVLSVS